MFSRSLAPAALREQWVQELAGQFAPASWSACAKAPLSSRRDAGLGGRRKLWRPSAKGNAVLKDQRLDIASPHLELPPRRQRWGDLSPRTRVVDATRSLKLKLQRRKKERSDRTTFDNRCPEPKCRRALWPNSHAPVVGAGDVAWATGSRSGGRRAD